MMRATTDVEMQELRHLPRKSPKPVRMVSGSGAPGSDPAVERLMAHSMLV
jgi:hypothetical protein